MSPSSEGTSLQALTQLNFGAAGESGIGKFNFRVPYLIFDGLLTILPLPLMFDLFMHQFKIISVADILDKPQLDRIPREKTAFVQLRRSPRKSQIM